MRPISGAAAQNHGFWGPAIATSYEKSAPPFQFIPFELSLTERLSKRRPSLESLLDEALLESECRVSNRQVTGRLRIYPPGVGVVRISIALTFREAVPTPVVAKIARDFEELPFVDPARGSGERCEALVTGVVAQVTRFLFGNTREVLWRPPAIVLNFSRYEGSDLQHDIHPLAWLMSVSREKNKEDEASIGGRLRAAIQSRHWTIDRVLAVAGQRTSLFLISSAYAGGNELKRKRLLEWLMETSELVSAAVYAQQAFAEEIGTLAQAPHEHDIRYLMSVFENTRNVLRAIHAAQNDIRRLGSGLLTAIADDVWRYNNDVDLSAVQNDLQAFQTWLADPKGEGASELAESVGRVAALAPLFAGSVSATTELRPGR